ncbi:MAG: tetratricopeptide repeat protein [candidate division WOR-3 bacterium]
MPNGRNLSLPLMLLLGILLAGCAYFNTFYNAQQYFREGMRLKSEGNAGQAQSKFDRSIEKSALVINHYPRSRWVDDALYLIGKAYFEKGEYARAVKSFEQLELVFPRSRYVPEAKLYHAVALIRNNQPGAGRMLLEIVKQRYPMLKATASYHAAVYEIEQGDIKEGIDSLLKFIRKFPKSQHYLPALRLLADACQQTGRYAEAVEWYQRYQLQESNPRKRTEAAVRLAQCLFLDKKYADALKAAREFRGRYPDLDEELNLIIGKALSALGRDEEAVAVLVNISSSNIRGAEAAFLLGKYYEQRREFVRARAYYDTARLRRADSDWGVMATKRAALLQAITSETTSVSPSATALFLLAEIHNLNLAEYDSAMTIYQRVADSFPQTELAPKALLAKAWILLRVKQDSANAVPVLNRIIASYPKTEYARAAQEWLAKIALKAKQQ